MKTFLTYIIVPGLLSNPAFAGNEKEKSLPLGLQMKLDRGGSLPPGLERNPVGGGTLEDRAYRHSEIVIPVDSEGSLGVGAEGRLIRLVKRRAKSSTSSNCSTAKRPLLSRSAAQGAASCAGDCGNLSSHVHRGRQ